MLKPYSKPDLYSLSQLPESHRREWLALVLLSPDTFPFPYYRESIDLLFQTEQESIVKNCELSRKLHLPLQHYRLDLFFFTRCLLSAATKAGIPLHFALQGSHLNCAVFPRPLQMGLISVLRAALPTGPVSVNASVTKAEMRFSVTAEGPFGDSDDLYAAAVIAAAHGGRLLISGNTAVFSFPPETKISAVPHWHTVESDGLLRDPLSLLNSGLYSFISSDC